jgi:aspartate carbamoyltransferase catalytic subunit
VVLEQVSNGVAVRMAVLEAVLDAGSASISRTTVPAP